MSKIYTKEESEKLEKRLDEFCKKNGLSFDNETNISSICKQLNILNFAIPLNEEKLYGVIIIYNETRAIAINEKLDVQDARFVIAHELAHYITEAERSGNKTPLFAERDNIFHGMEKRDEENDMDYLAAAMLIPKNQFIEELKTLQIDLKSLLGKSVVEVKKNVSLLFIDFLAKRYNVKEEVVIRRIAEVAYYA